MYNLCWIVKLFDNLINSYIMYLSNLKLWNFRKFTNEDGTIDLEYPHLEVPFTSGLNVLIGENDSGKTAVIDAIKIITKTHSVEWIRLLDSDFSKDRSNLRIELIFSDLTDDEAVPFTDKTVIDETTGSISLTLVLEAQRTDDRILPYEVKANNGDLTKLDAKEKEHLKVTYLRALRDADNDLTAKRNSRISQILLGHELFANGGSGKEKFEEIFSSANDQLHTWFNDTTGGNASNKSQIKDVIDDFIHAFISDEYDSDISVSGSDIKNILEKISIGILGLEHLGLGSMNRLFMASELLHLKKKEDGIKLCLIEELEAHLHPQAQMKVVESLQNEDSVQFIMSTHSPNLASKIKLDTDNTSVILFKAKDVFPLTKGLTKLESKDYKYLDNFLDVTKSNLFFAKGVIIVEGWAEDLLLPVLANNHGKNLAKHEVSIVNVGSTAYLHFARILMRNDGKKLNSPVVIVTDVDVKPENDWTFDANKLEKRKHALESNFDDAENPNVCLCVAMNWTLEWCLFKSEALSEMFKECCSRAHYYTIEFKKIGGEWNEELFREKLREKLINHSLDKVSIATELCQKIKACTSPIKFKPTDTAYYLIKAIDFVCK